MNDEKIKHLEALYDQLSNWSVGIDLHIKALEKQLMTHQEHLVELDTKTERLNDNTEIAELRKDIKAWVDGQRIGAKQLNELKEEFECHFRADKDYDLKYRKEIAELREQLKLERKIKVWDAKVINRTNKQLKELKQPIELLKKFQQGYIDRIIDLEENVRDFMIRVGGLGGWDFDYFIKKFDSNLKEDGKYVFLNSPDMKMETEKKEVDYGAWAKDMEASGGELSVKEVNNPMSSRSGMKAETDSKLPELKDFYLGEKGFVEFKPNDEPREDDDIHDYFMNHPDDLPRIKYQRLISEFLEKILAFNYALPTEPQIITIREWLEEMLK